MLEIAVNKTKLILEKDVISMSLKRGKYNKRERQVSKERISITCSSAYLKNKPKERKEERKAKGIDRDVYNRCYIATKIKQYKKAGIKEKDAIEKVIKEEKEVVAQFDYLTKNGLDIRQIFATWANNPHYDTVDKPYSNEDEGR